MSMKYSVVLPQMGMQTKDIDDPVEKFEAMVRVAQTADECGYEAVWLADHFMPVVAEVRGEGDWFECWTSTAALARIDRPVNAARRMKSRYRGDVSWRASALRSTSSADFRRGVS